MARLKLGPLVEDKPVRLTIELPGATHRNLVAYAAAHATETGQAVTPDKLVPPMLALFMASDRGFAKGRRDGPARG